MSCKQFKILFWYIFLPFLLFISCNKPDNYYYRGLHFLTHTENFQKENNLLLDDYGVNCNGTINTPAWDNIHHLRSTFYCIDNVNLEEARKKIIHCINEYLQLINSDQKLIPYLYKHPFTQNELSFTIIFSNENGSKVDKKYISMCSLISGIFRYFITPENDSFKPIHQETYEEALEKVKEQEKK